MKIVIKGDITKFEGDVIVNAANESLMGGGGVDGSIHRVAGPQLREACRQFEIILEGDNSWRRCKTGDVKITPGFRLPAKYVIHTVGPVWSGGSRHEAELLAGCYQKSLALAKENNLKIIAFPSISTGAYMFPIVLAAQIAHIAVDAFLRENPDFTVTFVCWEPDDYKAHMDIMNGEDDFGGSAGRNPMLPTPPLSEEATKRVKEIFGDNPTDRAGNPGGST